jgi:asparagine synthase (glutamine-hydrolysing)
MCEDVPREIDPIAMDQIFTFWTTLTPRTAFKDIYLKAFRGQVTINKYWDIPFYPRNEQMDLPIEKICEKIQHLLQDAIRIRLRADVPVGCYLSGGLDSSAITTSVVRNFNSNVRTFGIRFEDNNFDEGKYQNQMVSFLKVNHSEIQATNEKIGASLLDVLWHCEKPLLRTAPIPLFLLSDLVHKSGFKVVLTGEGADEVFGGYNIFREAKTRRFLSKYPHSKSRAKLIGQLYPYIFNNPMLKRTMQPFFAKDLDKTDDPVFSHLIRWENTSRIKTFFSEELRAAIGQYCGFEQVRQNLPAAYQQWDYLSKAQYLEMKIFLSNYLLSSQGDRVAMAHSVEIRLPYLDYRIIDFMGRVPAKWKIMGLNEKHILKKCFRDILPKEIINRPKHPYRAPIKQALLNGKMAEYIQEMLSERALEKTGLFDKNKVIKLLQKLQTTNGPGEIDNMALAGIVSSQLLYHQFIENFSNKAENFAFINLVVDRRSKALRYAS